MHAGPGHQPRPQALPVCALDHGYPQSPDVHDDEHGEMEDSDDEHDAGRFGQALYVQQAKQHDRDGRDGDERPPRPVAPPEMREGVGARQRTDDCGHQIKQSCQ